MSNTLNTPVEALERDYPLRVMRYELRRGSGGRGRATAAATASCASSRRCEMTFSLIAERRRHPPARRRAAGARGAAAATC